MPRKCWFILLLLPILGPAFGADIARLQGSWKLVSYEVEVQSTGEKLHPMGDHPGGYAMFSPTSRVWFLLTGEGRRSAQSAEGKAALLDSLIAYSGKYRVESDKWITSVDIAWNPAWVGTEQSRTFRIDGRQLRVFTPWRVMPNWPDKGMTRSIVTFERED